MYCISYYSTSADSTPVRTPSKTTASSSASGLKREKYFDFIGPIVLVDKVKWEVLVGIWVEQLLAAAALVHTHICTIGMDLGRGVFK